ncbi:response regulator [Pedobacter petrophilus]|uniref:Response regulator n=1 Tax=Pedobacter petrophilus TaxID=1908241 RepID=A0A7K0FV40_9SPHI|nr:LytTR family DNA-binding domain-containing protein [Pedobacter petrophilus]MRX74616.1 response regulator [Pedobacter petrophilus]
MYTCLAIDDEFSALEILTSYIAEQTNLKLIKAYSNPLIALSEITKRTKPVDIIFLDIEMPGINGLELAELIKHQTKKLIFTTAHANYAINSYELNADDFLLKPISQSKFERATTNLFSNDEIVHPPENEFILIKSKMQRNQLIKLKIADAIAIEAQEKGTKIYTKNEVIFSNSSLSEIAIFLLKVKAFSQIHRSFIISENKIKILERSHVVLSNDLKISIGRKYADFYHKMTNKN